jgi:uncharacterized protein
MPAQLLLCILLLSSVALAQPQPPRRIIDMHLHAYDTDPRFGTTFASPALPVKLVASKDAAAHTEETFAAMQRLNIVKGVVSGQRAAVLRWHERAPQQIIYGYDISHPDDIDVDLLRREHAAGRLQVLGETAPQYEGILPNDPRLEPLWKLAEELDVPVAFHMHPGPPNAPYFGFPNMRAANGNPMLLEDVLVRHPRLRIYIMHAGWPFLDEINALLYAHERVYVDLGALAWSRPRPEFYRFLRGLIDAGYGKRIMFGSDQMVWPHVIEHAVRVIEGADFLTSEQKNDIFYHNAARFLRLEEAKPIGQPSP